MTMISQYRTADERREAARQAVRESNHRAYLRRQGKEVPADEKGIARWWKERGH